MPHRRPQSGLPPRLRRLRWGAALACLLLAGGAGAAEPITVQLKWLHQFQFAGYYAAQDKGYYREAGLDVTLREAQPGADPVQTVLDGKAQYGVGSSALLLKRAAGEPVVVLASIFQHSASALFVRRGDNTQPLDWRGKRIMLAPGNEELQAYLKHLDVDLQRLHTLPHSFNLDDLVNGRVDAMSAYTSEAPYLLDRSNVRYEVLSPRAAGIDFYGDNLYTTESELREHPRRAAAMRAATLRGWQYAMAHPGEIADLIRARYPNSHSREHLMSEAQHTVPLLEQRLIELGYSNPARWRAIADTYAGLGMMPAGFPLDGFLYQPPSDSLAWQYGAGAAILLLLLAGAAALCVRRLKAGLAAAEDRARKAERLTSFALEGTGDGVWDWLPQEDALTLSPRYCDILGYDPAQFKPTAQEVMALVHPDDQARVADEFMVPMAPGVSASAITCCTLGLNSAGS